jgi:hypothetical protein
VDLSGWILRDDDDTHDFILPPAVLEPGGYLVLAQDTDRFGRAYPEAALAVGSFGFGLGNGGDAIRLFDATGIPQLNFSYGDIAPWPIEPDGAGYTLQLIDPAVYSVDPGAWTPSTTLGGTPGAAGR